MKFLVLIFLFGLASASFHDIFDDRDEEGFLLKAEQKKGKDDLQTEFGKKLRETLDHILREIKKAVQEGKSVSQELLDQVSDLVKKLKERGIEISDEAKDLIGYLETRVERWAEELKILLEKSYAVQRADDKIAKHGQKLREALRNILRDIKKAIEEGKHVSQQWLDKAKKLIVKLKEYGLDVGEEIKDILQYLETRISRWAEELLDAMRGKRSLGDRIRNLIREYNLEDHIQKLMDLLTGGTGVEKLKEFIKEHFTKSKYLTRKIMDWLEEGEDRLKSVLEKIFGKKEKRSILQKLKDLLKDSKFLEKIEELKGMIREGVENSKIKAFITEIVPQKFETIRDIFIDRLNKGKDRLKDMLEEWFPKSSGY